MPFNGFNIFKTVNKTSKNSYVIMNTVMRNKKEKVCWVGATLIGLKYINYFITIDLFLYNRC